MIKSWGSTKHANFFRWLTESSRPLHGGHQTQPKIGYFVRQKSQVSTNPCFGFYGPDLWLAVVLITCICLCLSVFMWRCRNPTLPSETVTEPLTSTQTQPSLINGGGRHTGNALQYIFMQETSFLAWHLCSVFSCWWKSLVLAGCLAIGRKPLETWRWPVSWTMMMRPVPCWKKSNQRYLCRTLVYDPSTKTLSWFYYFLENNCGNCHLENPLSFLISRLPIEYNNIWRQPPPLISTR